MEAARHFFVRKEVVLGQLKCQVARPFARHRNDLDSSGTRTHDPGDMRSWVRVPLESEFFLSLVKGRATWHFSLPTNTTCREEGFVLRLNFVERVRIAEFVAVRLVRILELFEFGASFT